MAQDWLPVSISQPNRYYLPSDLRFAGLIRSRGTEIIRIRFSRGPATVLDLPVSAELLSDLVQALHPLYGTPPEEMNDALGTLQKQGAIREK
jgi:hypothetical protein